MLKLFKYMQKREWTLMGASLIFIIAQVFLDLKMPEYMAEITQLVGREGSAISQVLTAGGWMLLCGLGSLLASFIAAGFAARIASNFSRQLRALQFDKIQSFSMAEIRSFSTASLITRSTNDIAQLQLVIAMGLQVIIKAPITAIWAMTKIAGKGWEWTAATAASVLLMVVLIGIIVIFAVPKFKKIQALTDNINRITRENLLGLRVLRAYNAELYQEEKFEKANVELTQNNLTAQRVLAIMNPGMGLIMNGLSLAIYWIGAYLIAAAATPDKMIVFSDMVVFINYAMQVVMSFMMLSMIFIMLPRATVAAKRIMEVIETVSTIQDGTRTAADEDAAVQGELEFQNVSFHYPGADEYVLRDVSFKAHAGETVAFIGATGSGKSSLINLVPRFYDVSEGSILINGIDVREYKQHALHNKFGYVAQKAILFTGSVASNVAYGDGAAAIYDEEDIRRAVSIAQGTDFVEKLDDGYQGRIARGGMNLSGGQKQRLAIARAVCRQPEIFIFDDSFSALDYRTDRALRHALQEQTAGATKLIVAQRIGTIRDADRIIVLDEGRVVGNGTHDELMQTCQIYQDIALSQLSKEELS